MQTQHISTILVSLSDRDQELQKKIERAKANANTSDDPAFWQEDLAYWQGRLAEIAEARQALFDAMREKQLVENIWHTNLFCYNLTMENKNIFVVYQDNTEFGTILIAAYFDESKAKEKAAERADYSFECVEICE